MRNWWWFEKKEKNVLTIQVTKEVSKTGLKMGLMFARHVRLATSTKKSQLLLLTRMLLFLQDCLTVKHVVFYVELMLQ